MAIPQRPARAEKVEDETELAQVLEAAEILSERLAGPQLTTLPR
jgi:hypothetical protein